jgi:hypothetical protein
VVLTSLVRFLLVKCDDPINCRLPHNIMMNNFLFCFWISFVYLFYIKYKFFDVIHFRVIFFYPTSIVSDTFIFSLWWDLAMIKCRCVVLKLTHKIASNFLLSILHRRKHPFIFFPLSFLSCSNFLFIFFFYFSFSLSMKDRNIKLPHKTIIKPPF